MKPASQLASVDDYSRMKNENPPRCIIFDLSEVFIAGLPGVEKRISTALSIPEDGLLECFGGEPVMQVLRGEISEDSYLGGILERTGWDLGLARLKRMIRDNFHVRIEGSLDILFEVVKTHHVVLLSDHVREWVPYIRSIHPFLDVFDERFYSFELGKTKSDPTVFPVVVRSLGYQPQECLFIDDRIRNVRSAESIGLPSIHFRNAAQLRADMRRRRVLP